MGAALHSKETYSHDFQVLRDRAEKLKGVFVKEVERLDPLFADKADFDEFKARHDLAKAERADLSSHIGPCYLGIDSGSTTSKLVLMDGSKRILYSYYGSNKGEPLKLIVSILKDLYSKLPDGAYIAGSTATGYGESLMKSALGVDFGEIETIAHYTAANHFLEGVDFILDIGGQDMKCMKIKDGAIDSIMLNEACSSGCGSFIESFSEFA